MVEYDIRPFRDGDEESLIRTFNLVFTEEHPELPPMTMERWDWEFRRNPAGQRIWVAAVGDEIVAQYAGLPARVWIAGRESVFTQIVDSMVHPDHRRGLKRPGLFVKVGQLFLDSVGGPAKDLVCWGMPVEPAWRIGQAFLKYELVRTQTLLGREPGPGPTDLPEGVEVLERFDHQARWLWDRCCGDWGASTIRDDTYLNWRFVERPDKTYRILGVRDDEGVLRGYAIYHFGNWIMPDMALLVDWLVPPGEPAVGEALQRAFLACARSDGAKIAGTIIPDWSPWFDIFQQWGFLVWPSDLLHVGRNYLRKFDMLWLRDHWWYQLGDTDLV
jgi:hypothetical protein